MLDLIDQIDLEIEKYSLLKHDFYRLWQEGKLTLDHLAGYSREYFQLVKAVPMFVENILKANEFKKYEKLIQNTLKEEQEHIEPWVNFSSSLNVARNQLMEYEGEDLTQRSVGEMIRLSESSFEEAVAVMYALEKQLPKISETKLDGLAKFYGITDKNASEYFNIHKEIDIHHSKIWENIIKGLPDDKREKILNAITLSLQSQNRLLDSVKDKYVDNTIAC